MVYCCMSLDIICGYKWENIYYFENGKLKVL